MGLDVLGFRDSEFIPWPDDFRDEDHFATWEDQFLAAEFQTDLLEVGGLGLWSPSQVLLPEAWNRSASLRVWSPVTEDPRVEHVHGAIYVPSAVLQERLPAALARADENTDEDLREMGRAKLHRIVSLAKEVEDQGHRLLLVVSP